MQRKSVFNIMFFGALGFWVGSIFGDNVDENTVFHSHTMENFLESIHLALQEKAQNHAFENWFYAREASIQNTIDMPEPVPNVTQALVTKTWLFDPSIEVSHDVLDARGNMILKAGSKFNPLSKFSWNRSLVFYDGNNVEQVRWVSTLSQSVKCILVNGSVTDQTQKLHQRVYFDQGGRLVQRLGIRHTPTLVQQEGLFLRITEFKL